MKIQITDIKIGTHPISKIKYKITGYSWYGNIQVLVHKLNECAYFIHIISDTNIYKLGQGNGDGAGIGSEYLANICFNDGKDNLIDICFNFKEGGTFIGECYNTFYIGTYYFDDYYNKIVSTLNIEHIQLGE